MRSAKWFGGFFVLLSTAGCVLEGGVAAQGAVEPSMRDDEGKPGGSQSEDPEGSGAPATGDEPSASGGGNDTGNPSTTTNTPAPAPVIPKRQIPSSTVRRLSVVEMTNTYEQLLGFVPEAVSRVPPDNAGYGFDRVVNSQTISQSHLDAFGASGNQAAFQLVAEQRLDDLAAACPDEIMPPAVASSRSTIIGAMMSLAPDWSIQPVPSGSTSVELLYATDPSAEYRHSFPAPGQYELALSANAGGAPVDSGQLEFNGAKVADFEAFEGGTVLRSTVTVDAAGDVTFKYGFTAGGNLRLRIESVEITGPVDASTATEEQRRACATSIIDDFGPKVYRRPVTTEEKGRLLGLYDTLYEESGFTTAIQQTITALLSSPYFLYLVEVGDPVEGNDDLRMLNSWEVASRLSYALCEEPPDAELVALAQTNGLQSADVVKAQAQRLLAKDCAKETVRRFYQQWLGVQSFLVVAKSLDLFPKFTGEVRQGMFDEVNRYIDEMFWNEQATLETFYTSREFWPNPATDSLYGLNLSETSKQRFPAERAGVLSLPAVLAAHSAFNETNPVERGLFVLERMVCVELPSPSFVVAPPTPDPTLTTRERWRQHSSQPECAACHLQIDPVGFALESFDAIGEYRTEENGHPIDDKGGVPSIGVADGEVEGGVALANAIAQSDEAAACFAEHWLKFVLGRSAGGQDTTDEEWILELAQSFKSQSMQAAMVELFGSDTFLLRSAE